MPFDQAKPVFRFMYTGPSMNPLLRLGDDLHVLPYDRPDLIRPGDVVVFRSPMDQKTVVHRILSRSGNGFLTQGDNNSEPDPYTILPENIIGRVIQIAAGNKSKSPYNGTAGLLYFCLQRGRVVGRTVLHQFMRSLFLKMHQSGIFFHLRRILPQMHFISFHRSQGMEWQCHMMRHMAARLLPGEKEWAIRIRYLPFFNSEYLEHLHQSNAASANLNKDFSQ